MTELESGVEPALPVPRPQPPARSRRSQLWAAVQFAVSLLLAGGVLAYLLWVPPAGTSAAASGTGAASAATVQIIAPFRLRIEPECSLGRKLRVAQISTTTLTSPLLTATGTVVASLRPGNGKGPDYWQFNAPELLTVFTDWQKATADIKFNETQLTQVQQLAETRVDAQRKLVERMTKLVKAGTDTEKDLAAAEAELIQAQIHGRKDVHEADSALRIARRNETALARQLQQAGLEPDLFAAAASDLDIVVADVPEALMSRVKVGQGCEARFYGLPEQKFIGRVRSISPVLSKERRSLRVLFNIDDPQDRLRPGMFAEIGLGTDAREALLIPLEGVVHVGRADYVLVRQAAGLWRVQEVRVGEVHESAAEILGGLRSGDEVAGWGAILLKPFIMQALRPSAETGAGRS